MNNTNEVLDYYISYESEESLNNISFNNGYLNIMPKNLHDLNKLNTSLQNEKIKLIKNQIEKIEFRNYNKKKVIVEKLDSIKINNSLFGNLFNFKEEIQKNDYKYQKNYYVDLKNINQIIQDNTLFIFYPILANGKKKIPFISFQVEIKENELVVVDYRVQIEALRRIVSEIVECDFLDADNIIEDFYNFHEAISVYANKNVLELVEMIENEMIAKFKEYNFNGFWKFKNYDKWAATEEIVFTMESFGDLILPPYKEEIEEVKYYLKNSTSKLINQYLFGCKNEILSDDIEVDSHMGSYTSKYAINEKQGKIMKSAENVNLLAVSGPPGTGKTTILKEIIANNIVRKVELLIREWDSEWQVLGTDKQMVYQSPLGGNCNYSMVIASGNNKAVDNIGVELLNELDYFSNVINSDECTYKGISCAKLGRKDNMDEFKKNVLNPLINYLSTNPGYNVEEAQNLNLSFLKIKKFIEDLNESVLKFIEKRDLFYNELFEYGFSKEDINEEFMNKKIKICEVEIQAMQLGIKKLEDELKAHNDNEKKKYEDVLQISKSLNNNLEQCSEKERQVELIEKCAHTAFIGKYRARSLEKKYGHIDQLRNQVNLLLEEQEFINKKYMVVKKEYESIEQNIVRLQNEHNQKVNDFNVMGALKLKLLQINTLKSELNDLKEKGLSNIYWHSPRHQFFNHIFIVEQRNKLFQLALNINENYIRKNASVIKSNLDKVYPERWFQPFYRPNFRYNETYQTYMKSMWETLFLCFPVVTTTLYSFDRKKFPMIQEMFDTLLIDEAGQSAIHTVIGPLYRFRNAIIVGDVLQLEPIHKYENKIIENTKFEDQIKNLVDVSLNSIQDAANRASDVYDKLNDKKVGIVLNEHRRCEKSIVEFSNKFVYDKQLIVTKADTEKQFLKYNLCMIDVRATQSLEKRNVNVAEVNICKKVIENLVAIHGEEFKKEIAIITPYRNQADLLKTTFPDIDSGTVHVFQGKEKEVIIFSIVAGGTFGKNNMDFIGKKSNNLNVAFTRAKQQLILIGNYEACQNANNYITDAVRVVKSNGKLYSLYEEGFFEDNDLEEVYKNQFLTIMSEDVNNKNAIDMVVNKYANNGVITTAKVHNNLLMSILPIIESSISVVSPWIRASTVNNEFITSLEQLLHKDKIINIGFGYHKTNLNLTNIKDIIYKDNFGTNLDKDVLALEKLHMLLKDKLHYIPPLHSKILIIDSRIMIVGSHNWLSNTGKLQNTKDEVSCIIYNQNAIEYIQTRYQLK